MKNKKITKKYKKSINNFQCIGPCYDGKTYVVHPVYLKYINKQDDKPFCPTEPHLKYNEVTNKNEEVLYDYCENPTDNVDVSLNDSAMLFQSGFSKETFLSLYYNINTFEEALEWLNNNNFLLLDTKIRVINAALNVYGNNLTYFDDIFVNFYIDYIKEKFSKKIYKQIHKNIGISDGNIIIVKDKNNNLEYDDYIIERINYIIENFFDVNKVKNFLSNLLKKKNINFDEYNDNLIIIADNNIEYIKNNIKN